uniref:Uncharacterized protein n=1 Tax=Opuntia streptacantha TaxID=393608 RepID=A0A7C9A8A5_OPUST
MILLVQGFSITIRLQKFWVINKISEIWMEMMVWHQEPKYRVISLFDSENNFRLTTMFTDKHSSPCNNLMQLFCRRLHGPSVMRSKENKVPLNGNLKSQEARPAPSMRF